MRQVSRVVDAVRPSSRFFFSFAAEHQLTRSRFFFCLLSMNKQVGDRLIPVGITSSRDPLQPMQLGPDVESDGGSTNSRSGRRGIRRGRDGEITQMLQGMGIGVNGPDIEEVSLGFLSRSISTRRVVRFPFLPSSLLDLLFSFLELTFFCRLVPCS